MIPADTLRQRPDVRLSGYRLLAAAANTKAVSEFKNTPIQVAYIGACTGAKLARAA